MHTLFSWAYGADDDPTDRGISQDIDGGFDELKRRLDELEEISDERHQETIDRIRQLVEQLHHEEALEFDRDDVE